MTDVSRASTFIRVDALGIDPLLDDSYDAVKDVVEFSWHKIRPEEEFKSRLLALRTMQNENYERYLLIYNDMLDPFELTSGKRIKIPSVPEMLTRLTDASARDEELRIVAI
jgi:hypothetical protein